MLLWANFVSLQLLSLGQIDLLNPPFSLGSNRKRAMEHTDWVGGSSYVALTAFALPVMKECSNVGSRKPQNVDFVIRSEWILDAVSPSLKGESSCFVLCLDRTLETFKKKKKKFWVGSFLLPLCTCCCPLMCNTSPKYLLLEENISLFLRACPHVIRYCYSYSLNCQLACVSCSVSSCPNFPRRLNIYKTSDKSYPKALNHRTRKHDIWNPTLRPVEVTWGQQNAKYLRERERKCVIR